jgi:hypothetical protein
MTDEELRALVRDAIARHLGGQQPSAGAQQPSQAAPAAGTPAPAPLWRSHPSFAKFLVARGDEGDGACIIEPAVHCNHCGYCQSYGH